MFRVLGYRCTVLGLQEGFGFRGGVGGVAMQGVWHSGHGLAGGSTVVTDLPNSADNLLLQAPLSAFEGVAHIAWCVSVCSLLAYRFVSSDIVQHASGT